MSFVLPDLRRRCSGWIDYDRHILRDPKLSFDDRVSYLEGRLALIFFRSMDRVFQNRAPMHKAVNGPSMSFFLIGTICLCCAIETMGGFIIGGDPSNYDRFHAFLRPYLPQWNGRTAKGTDLGLWMWKHLRNALAHSLTIEEGGMSDLGQTRFREVVQGEVEVHVEILYRDFKSGFARYVSDLRNTRNRALRSQFEKRFREVFVRPQEDGRTSTRKRKPRFKSRHATGTSRRKRAF